MAVGLNIALDLGSDTLKVAYAYDSAGGVHYGKLSRRGLPTEVAIPAIAHYDQTTREWRFGYDVDRSKGASSAGGSVFSALSSFQRGSEEGSLCL